MNRRELVRVIAAHTDSDPKQVDAILKGTVEVITALVAKGEVISLPGFAKFAKVKRAARMGRNPATGEPVKIKASTKARITPLKGFKDAVLTPSTAPKLDRSTIAAATAPAKKAAVRTATTRSAAPPVKKAGARKVAAKKAPAAKKAAVRKAGTRTVAAKKAPAAKKAATRR